MSDEIIVRTSAEVYAEIGFILEHDPHHYRLINQAWAQISPGGTFSLKALTTLASHDVERFLFVVRRLVQREVVADASRYTAVPS